MLTPSELRDEAATISRGGSPSPSSIGDKNDLRIARMMEHLADLCEQVAELRESLVPDFIIAECSGREYRIPNPKKHKPPQPRMWNTDESLPRGYYAVKTSLGLWDTVKFITGGYQEIGGERMFYGPIPLPE